MTTAPVLPASRLAAPLVWPPHIGGLVLTGPAGAGKSGAASAVAAAYVADRRGLVVTVDAADGIAAAARQLTAVRGLLMVAEEPLLTILHAERWFTDRRAAAEEPCRVLDEVLAGVVAGGSRFLATVTHRRSTDPAGLLARLPGSRVLPRTATALGGLQALPVIRRPGDDFRIVALPAAA